MEISEEYKRILVSNLYSLLEENINGIWLTKLKEKYEVTKLVQIAPFDKYSASAYVWKYVSIASANERDLGNMCASLSQNRLEIRTANLLLKFGYPISLLCEFADEMNLVMNFPSVFFLKQFKSEGDYLLLDARKYKRVTENSNEGTGHIPQPVVEELRKLLKNNKEGIFTDVLLQEYQRMYQKKLQPSAFGFQELDSFLLHLENFPEFSFRKTANRVVLSLNYDPTNVVDTKSRGINQRLPGHVTTDPFPSEVCDRDFHLGIDETFHEMRTGNNFEVNPAEIISPEEFYVTHISKVNLLENMMADLNEFYELHGENYQIRSSHLSRDLLCACLFSKTQKWHRARIEQYYKDSAEAKVVYIDYGTTEEVAVEQLRYLHRDFAKYPPLCIRAKLLGIKPKDGSLYSYETCYKFYLLLGSYDLELEVVKTTPECLVVRLYTVVGTEKVDIGEELIEENLVERDIVDEAASKKINDGFSQRFTVSSNDERKTEVPIEKKFSTSKSINYESNVTRNESSPTADIFKKIIEKEFEKLKQSSASNAKGELIPTKIGENMSFQSNTSDKVQSFGDNCDTANNEGVRRAPPGLSNASSSLRASYPAGSYPEPRFHSDILPDVLPRPPPELSKLWPPLSDPFTMGPYPEHTFQPRILPGVQNFPYPPPDMNYTLPIMPPNYFSTNYPYSYANAYANFLELYRASCQNGLFADKPCSTSPTDAFGPFTTWADPRPTMFQPEDVTVYQNASALRSLVKPTFSTTERPRSAVAAESIEVNSSKSFESTIDVSSYYDETSRRNSNQKTVNSADASSCDCKFCPTRRTTKSEEKGTTSAWMMTDKEKDVLKELLLEKLLQETSVKSEKAIQNIDSADRKAFVEKLLGAQKSFYDLNTGIKEEKSKETVNIDAFAMRRTSFGHRTTTKESNNLKSYENIENKDCFCQLCSNPGCGKLTHEKILDDHVGECILNNQRKVENAVNDSKISNSPVLQRNEGSESKRFSSIKSFVLQHVQKTS